MSTRNDPWTGVRTSGLTITSACILPVAAALCWPVSSSGLGFRIPNQDAEAIGRGNAFIATANNPSAIYYNPAGITQLEGSYVQFGAHSIAVNSEYTSSAGQYKTEWELQSVPQLYYTVGLKDKPFTFGLGIYAPYGLGLEWPTDAPFINAAHEGRLLYVNVNPVLAWKINDQISIAFGPSFNYSKVKLRQGPNDDFKFIGDDFDYSLHAGVRWQPHEQWAFGATYHSASTMNYHGKSSFSGGSFQGTSAELEFPQFIMAGVSYRPTPRWNVEVGIDWTDWDTLNTVVFKGTAAGDLPLALNWQSSFMYHAGASYYFDNSYYVSAGYFFSENSTSTENFNPIVPDTDLHVVSLGVGYKGQRWSWAVAAQIIAGPVREVRGSQNPFANVDGDYQFFNQAINFSIGYRY